MSTIDLSEIKNDNRLRTPEQMLRGVLQELESGQIPAKRMMVIFLDDSDDKYDVGYRATNISSSQIVALLSVIRQWALDDLK